MGYQFDFAALLPYWPDFLSGAWVTLQLTVGAVVFGMVIGVICAIARRSRYPALRAIAGVYVDGGAQLRRLSCRSSSCSSGYRRSASACRS